MTPKERAAMQQALEVLEKHVESFDYEHFTSVCELDPAKDTILILREALKENEMAKIEGINMLDRFTSAEQAEQEPITDAPFSNCKHQVCDLPGQCVGEGKCHHPLKTIEPVKQEQAEQEPLVRFCPGCGSIGEVDSKYRDCCPDWIKARLVPSRFAEECQDLFNLAIGNVAPVQQPVAYCCGFENTHPDGWIDCKIFRDGEFTTPLYAAPVRTKDLTDAITLLEEGLEGISSSWNKRTRAVIAKHKEKNG